MMNAYTYESAKELSLKYFEGDSLAADVYLTKYALRNKENLILEPTPAYMHMRIAKEFARVEQKFASPLSLKEIFKLLSDVDHLSDEEIAAASEDELIQASRGFGRIIPQGSPLSGIGNHDQIQSLSNCFVIDSPHDSYGGILKTDQEEAQIMKRRGGVGFDISNIRPKGMPTSNAARTTTGIGTFMERFSNTCREVGQDGRRGALMLTISCFEGSVRVLTEEGWLRVDEVVDGRYGGKVWTHEGWKEIEAYQRFENRDVFIVESEDGKSIATTIDHEFMVKNNTSGEEYLKPLGQIDGDVEELIVYNAVYPHTELVKAYTKISSIIEAGTTTVYDFTVKDTHRILANGFYTSNCNHPEIDTFINIKRDKSKVTGANISVRYSDEFMRAVKSDSEYVLRWPVDASPENAKYTRTVKAKEIWRQMTDAAWYSAEPGVLFWDTVLRNTPAEIYANKGFGTTSTNPCLTGDTLVSVADGRGSVPIKQLAEEGLDVPVYARADDGKIVIKTMRNPRITGYNIPVYEVTIEGGHKFKATANHKLLTTSGQYKEVKDLVTGDALEISKRVNRRLVEIGQSIRKSNNRNNYVVLENNYSGRSEHRMIYEYHHGQIANNHVIHHVDFNSQNNAIENLQSMSHADHIELHRRNMLGDKNPMRRAQSEWSEEKWSEYRSNMSEACSGLKNGNAYDNVTNEELFAAAVECCRINKHRVSGQTWSKFASEKNYPSFLVDCRIEPYKSFQEWITAAALLAGVDDLIIACEPRVAKTYQKALKQGYEAKIEGSETFVKKICEGCKQEFWKRYDCREGAYCSVDCANDYLNSNVEIHAQRTESVRTTYSQKAEVTRAKQLDAYTQLRFSLGRDPLLKEWITACKNNKTSFRLSTTFGFKSWPDLKEHAALHNHRVVSVEYAGTEDVYNGTVDDVHNFYFGNFEEQNNEQIQLLSKNCGEIVLSPGDSCRLLVIDLSKFVSSPFVAPEFMIGEYAKTVRFAQRLMDDLVELEIESVDKILAKIQDDPEDEDVKSIEHKLWTKIRIAATDGRRTGTGLTAVGDCLAMLNVRYGSDESLKLVEDFYQLLAENAYKATIELAKDRGAFPAYEYELEKDHHFIKRVVESCGPETVEMYKKYGRRNIALTTTAPVGSVSAVLRTSSGIEPVFQPVYKRRRKINPGDAVTKVDFIDDMGDKWQEYDVYHEGVKKWMSITGQTDVTKSPYFGADSASVDWDTGVQIQAKAQKWICHAISRTANFPKSAKHSEISDVYFKAWESGCKGFTVYREGARSGVLLTNNEFKSWFDGVENSEVQEMIDVYDLNNANMPSAHADFIQVARDELAKRSGTYDNRPVSILDSHSPKRPKELECDIHRVNVAGEIYLVLVGLLGKKPYEIFAGLSQHVEIPKKIKKGYLVKNGKKDGIVTYNLIIRLNDEDDLTFRDIVNLFDNPVYGALTRTISLALRHGVAVNYIAEQLKKDKHSDITSFSSSIARVLSKGYIADGTKSFAEKKCESCGAATLVYQQGCVSCASCGYSKC